MARRADSLSRAHRQRLTDERKRAFLEALRIYGVASRAAREASPNAMGKGAISTFRDERERDAEFAASWDEALEAHAGDLLVELYRRAVAGDQVPIQNAKGEVIGWRSLRSDKLLLEAVRARHRDFTPRTQTEATVEQTLTPGKPRPGLGLDQLSPENQEKLLAILENERGRLNGTEPTGNRRSPSVRLPLPERER